MSKDIVLPDYLRDLMEEGKVVDDAANLITAQDSVPRISLKGNKFSLIVDGEVQEKIKEEMMVIILGTQPDKGNAKTFYLGDYAPDDSSPPDCSSSNGVSPDGWVSSPQADLCATCPQNKWGSAESMSGGKAKACRDSKRLMVLNAKDLEGPIYVLNVTVSSLKNLTAYGKRLAEAHMPLAAGITKVSLDEDSDFPKLEFAFAGAMKEKMGVAMLKRSSEKEWDTGPALEAPKAKPALAQSEAPTEKAEEKVVEGTVEKDDSSDDSSTTDVDDLLGDWESED